MEETKATDSQRRNEDNGDERRRPEDPLQRAADEQSAPFVFVHFVPSL
jgi:hypothetical protein